jgi:alpha-beta hydrolase superfamily lysophospholipase
MIDLETIHYPAFDKPEICRLLFYPRREWDLFRNNATESFMIQVQKDVAVGARFHEAGKGAPTILFFHGNGEIAADYDDFGATYRQMGINFLPVDYRGYGLSSGNPTMTAMMRDAHLIFASVLSWLAERTFNGPFVVMGRSLGSSPALEVARHYGERIDGLVIESGFARILPLLCLLGVDDPKLTEESGPQNLEKIRQVKKPTLIIHAEGDQIIPITEGMDLYGAAAAVRKRMIKITGADHNDIFLRGREMYLDAIGKFMEMVAMER